MRRKKKNIDDEVAVVVIVVGGWTDTRAINNRCTSETPTIEYDIVSKEEGFFFVEEYSQNKPRTR